MSGATPRVTVGIPFYNASATLADAIRSVFAQTFQDWELILVDDGSTDGSLDIALQVRDPRVRVLSDGLNQRLASRLNQIASEARAPLLARMDADDLMHPLRLEMQVGYMTDHPETDVLGSPAYVLDGRDRVVGILGRNSKAPSPLQALLDRAFVHPTTMMKTSWARSHPYGLESLRAEDAELWSRSFSDSHFAHISIPLLYYRTESSFSFKKYSASTRTARLLTRRYGPLLIGRPWSVFIWFLSLVKTMIYAVATPIGIQDPILALRHVSLSGEVCREPEEVLKRVKGVRVPCFSSMH